mmetsp:Transcript_14645/g.34754  ORF Transcript_14645/g.34754 Transcript_14645/m.34754 type:complete len:206 (+) Transcript_14645:59-676(+)
MEPLLTRQSGDAVQASSSRNDAEQTNAATAKSRVQSKAWQQKDKRCEDLQSPEDRAWELLLAISGAHAESFKGTQELRRLASEAQRLLQAYPVQAEPPVRRRTWVSSLWAAVRALLGTIRGLLMLVASVCHDVVSILVLAATGQAEERETEGSAAPDASEEPKARNRGAKLRKPPKGRTSFAKARLSVEGDEEEEEEDSRGCSLS